MGYSTYLPTNFTSWFDFYKQAKFHLEEGQEDLYIQVPSQVNTFTPTIQINQHKYSIQYIKNQAFEELYELRELQTFTFEELHCLRSALELSGRYNSNDTMQLLQKKIVQQIINIRKAKTQGL